MLGKLFGSKARVKILKLFLTKPEGSYYIREVARDLGLQINSVRRELENLEKFGLLKSFSADNLKKGEQTGDIKPDRKYYKVDAEFILFEEIKALILKAQVLYERDFADKLQSAGRPKLLLLTGFFCNDEKSPTDLLVVGRLNKTKLMKLIRDLEKDLGKEINYTIMDKAEFKYRRDITDVFLFNILESKKIVVIDEVGIANF